MGSTHGDRMADQQTQPAPIALTIAGSDSSGGAGIQADLKTFTALGVYGASVLTALTAQNTRGVDDVLPIPPAFVRAQIDSVLSDLDVKAAKTGMLANADVILAVAEILEGNAEIPLVCDPVMVATSGDVLLEPDAIGALRERLIPRASLLTPNIPEAARLLGCPEATDLDEMARQAEALRAFGCAAVLLKGGHGSGKTATDIFAHAGGIVLPRHRASRREHAWMHAWQRSRRSGCRRVLEQAVRRSGIRLSALEPGPIANRTRFGPVDHLAIRRQPLPSKP